MYCWLNKYKIQTKLGSWAKTKSKLQNIKAKINNIIEKQQLYIA